LSDSDLYKLTAVEAKALLADRKVSAVELVQASISRIEAVDENINAMVTRCFERALEHARTIDAAKALDDPGWLGGLPVGIKDLTPTAGVRTTYGSRIYENHVPEKSDVLVETLEAYGGIVMGKTNTPEFAAGASTFNDVFGITRNPWNTSKSVAGSSGGSGAALASGQVFLASGSDLGGSLRTPASFNSVVGLRPGPGRVPHGPLKYQFSMLFPDGLMARSPLDLALGMDAVSRPDPRDPFSYDSPAVAYVDQVADARLPGRIAYSPDLGILPVDPVVRRIARTAADQFQSMGVEVDETQPDFSDATDIFQVLRAALFATEHADHLREHRDKLKPDVIWNIEKGLALNADEIGRAEIAQAALFQRVATFFENYEFLICPTAIVPPFDAEVRYVEEVDGVKFDNYVAWIGITSAITLTGCPAVSVPSGFTDDGLPVGVQIVGPPRSEGRVLAAAHLLDQATGISSLLPIDPRVA